MFEIKSPIYHRIFLGLQRYLSADCPALYVWEKEHTGLRGRVFGFSVNLRLVVGIWTILVKRSQRLRRLLYLLSLRLLKGTLWLRRAGAIFLTRLALHLSQYLFRTASSRTRNLNANRQPESRGLPTSRQMPPLNAPNMRVSKLGSDSRYVARRFLLKVYIILMFAVAQSHLPWGFGNALAMMLFMSAAISCVLAIASHERFRIGTLSYWDEALVFGFLGQTVRWVFLH